MIDSQQKRQTAKQKEELFVAGIREYKHNLFRMAQSILHHDAEAEDAVGETIYKAYSRLGALRSLDRFKPWIMKILVNECYAAAKRRSRIYYQADPEQESDGLKNAGTIVQETGGDSSRELWVAVSRLEQEFSTVVVLFYYEDLSIKHIAKVLSLPEGTVKSRLARAKQKLKVLLENEKDLESEKISRNLASASNPESARNPESKKIPNLRETSNPGKNPDPKEG